MGALAQLRGAAWDRAGGRCEITGVWLGERDSDEWALHHRRVKGMGGSSRDDTHVLSNVLALSHAAHNLGPRPAVHLDVAWARERGYLVGQHQHPRLVPVLLRGRARVLLTDDGGYVPLARRGPAATAR